MRLAYESNSNAPRGAAFSACARGLQVFKHLLVAGGGLGRAWLRGGSPADRVPAGVALRLWPGGIREFESRQVSPFDNELRYALVGRGFESSDVGGVRLAVVVGLVIFVLAPEGKYERDRTVEERL